MRLRDLQRFHPPSLRGYHPDAYSQPGFRIRRDGEVTPTTGLSKVCLRCNSEKVMPMRMPGFTMYECMTCRHIWRDSYDKPGPTLRPKEWRGLRRRPWQRLQGRVVA